jgi:titin
VEALEDRLVLATFIVTNTNDAGPGSLRLAIDEVNNTPGTDTIGFNIGGGGAQVIRPLSELPTITNPVIVDGTAQPGYAGRPLIDLDGTNAGSDSAGIWITAGSSTVRGLAIHDFTNTGLLLQGGGGNQATSDFLGTDLSATAARGNGLSGVGLLNSSNNVIGGTSAALRNVICANHGYGINIFLNSDNNVVVGNLIGTDITGMNALGNQFSGIGISTGASNNVIGGTTPGARNIISGNGTGDTGDGVSIFTAANGNVVEGNFIGTDISGARALPNRLSGVSVSGSSNTQIGGLAPGAGNVVSGNQNYGVAIFSSASGNQVLGNAIGTDSSGTIAVPNSYGVGLDQGANRNYVGGVASGAGNVISGNLAYGIAIFGNGSDANIVQANVIGTDVTGTQAVPNGSGINISQGASGNLIGGTSLAARNFISGNLAYGVFMSDAATRNNLVQGNLIGTDVYGVQPLGNGDSGVGIFQGANNNTVGGLDPGAGNVISANGLYGVDVFLSANNNSIIANAIGTDVTGTNALGNGYGVGMYTGAHDNLVGGTAPGARNLISGNVNFGVVLFSSNTQGNQIQGNVIGIDEMGNPLGNGSHGVLIAQGASNNLIGGTDAGAGNQIAYNSGFGVTVDSGTGNAIRCNSIHSHPDNLGIGLINGGNNLQDAPQMDSATSDGTTTVCTGSLASAPDTQYTLDLFANSVCNPSGFGEGEQYLGSMDIVTGDDGNASFSFTLAVGVNVGWYITATATDPGGNTSQFSNCQVVGAPSDVTSGNDQAAALAVGKVLAGGGDVFQEDSAASIQASADLGEHRAAVDLLFASASTADRGATALAEVAMGSMRPAVSTASGIEGDSLAQLMNPLAITPEMNT